MKAGMRIFLIALGSYFLWQVLSVIKTPIQAKNWDGTIGLGIISLALSLVIIYAAYKPVVNFFNNLSDLFSESDDEF